MAENVIDALVVTLGIRSDGFNSGLKTATQSLTGFAAKVGGLVLGFQGLEAGIKYFTHLHEKMADLEFTARNLGVLGTSLSKLGEMAQMFGGSFDDAKSSVEGLQSAAYNLRFHGQMSDQLIALQRWGVAYLDQAGHVRNEIDIARDVAKRIDWQSERTPGGMEPGQRRQMALDMLGSGAGGLASAAAAGAAEFDKVWERVKKDQQGLSERGLQANADAYRDLDVSRRAKTDIRNMPVMLAMLPALEALNEKLQDLAAKAMPFLTKAVEALANTILHPPEVIKDIAKAAVKLEKSVSKLASTVLPPVKPGEKPVGALSPQGIYRMDETLIEHFDQWMSRFTGIPMSTVPAIPTVVPPAIPTPTAPRPPASTGTAAGPPTSMNAAPTTNITFENVTINSRGQNGQTLARDFVGEARRKLMAASSERGLG